MALKDNRFVVTRSIPSGTLNSTYARGCAIWRSASCTCPQSFEPPPPPPPPPVCYRNAQGMRWDGQGEMPDWLRRAVNAGQSVEFFRIG
ncbi:H-NS family nucleoid-associated regulatory protein [Cupriavidus necator]